MSLAKTWMTPSIIVCTFTASICVQKHPKVYYFRSGHKQPIDAPRSFCSPDGGCHCMLPSRSGCAIESYPLLHSHPSFISGATRVECRLGDFSTQYVGIRRQWVESKPTDTTTNRRSNSPLLSQPECVFEIW